MKNLDQLKRQHLEILGILNETKGLVQQQNIDKDGQTIAKNISIIAGKLQIHLGNEDKFLYPSFINSSRKELKNKAQAYTDEMGDLSNVYTEFKNKYNTRSKIMSDANSFTRDFETIFKAIEKRIHKEDNDLYKIAEEL